MAIKLLTIFTVLLLLVAAFFTGAWWKGQSILNGPIYNLKKEIHIQQSPKHTGKIPAGSTFYEYRVLPEMTTYILFVNVKERDIFNKKEFDKQSVIAPISGYPVD